VTYLVLGYAAGAVLIGGYAFQTWRVLRALEHEERGANPG
jgi:hypothetical protein